MPSGRRNRNIGSSPPTPSRANNAFRLLQTKPEYFNTESIPKLSRSVGTRTNLFFLAKAAFHAFLPSLSSPAFASANAVLFFDAMFPSMTAARYVVSVVARRYTKYRPPAKK